MGKNRIYDVNIASHTIIPTPGEIKAALPLSRAGATRIYEFRETIRAILDGRDSRLMIVVGPCSIHNIDGAREYARRLKSLSDEVADRLFLIMRVYFEKPRTTTGWKGFINDPFLDDSFRLDRGLVLAREFLVGLVTLGLPAGTEALDPNTPQYIGDLITWTAIGARTTESQTHREMASGLSTPVGFKNATDGNIEIAINALKSARTPHHFLGLTQDGHAAVYHTRGNPYGHLVLRGGKRPNYDRASVAACKQALVREGLRPVLLVDCSHANSGKDPARQEDVARYCIDQVVAGERGIVGLMIESNLEGGRQAMTHDGIAARPGLSITDPCLDWSTTERIIRRAHARLAHRTAGRWRKRRSGSKE